MSQIQAFIRSLRTKGVTLWCTGDRLRFRASKGTLTADEIARLRENRDEILIALNQDQLPQDILESQQLGATIATAPLTFQQRSFWEFLKIASDWNCLDVFALRVKGALNSEHLERCFEAVIWRHGALRTRISIVDGVPTQTVDAPCRYTLRLLDLSNESIESVNSSIQSAANSLAQEDCDLSIGPLFDAQLLKLEDKQHVLIWGIHHLISDGFAICLLFKEIWYLYSELTKRTELPLQRLPLQYSDYSLWQHGTYNDWIAKSEVMGQTNTTKPVQIYWPMENIASISGGQAGTAVIEISFEKTLSVRLREVARRMHMSPGIVVLSVYIAVVAQWTDLRSLVIETSVTGRDHPGQEGMIGYCAHALHLPIRLTGKETLVELASHVNNEFLRALSRMDFGAVPVRATELANRTMFQWMPWQRLNDFYGVPNLDTPVPFSVEPYTVSRRARPSNLFKVMTVFWDGEDGIRGSVCYRRDAFPATVMKCFAEDLQRSVAEASTDPHSRVRLWLTQQS